MSRAGRFSKLALRVESIHESMHFSEKAKYTTAVCTRSLFAWAQSPFKLCHFLINSLLLWRVIAISLVKCPHHVFLNPLIFPKLPYLFTLQPANGITLRACPFSPYQSRKRSPGNPQHTLTTFLLLLFRALFLSSLSFSDFSISSPVNSGSFGTVWFSTWKIFRFPNHQTSSNVA